MPNTKNNTEWFVEQMGLAAEQDRLPRIAGRIMGLLLLEEGSLGLDEITERLRVSRASVSTNSRLLENLDILERVTQPGDRRDYFQCKKSPGRKLLALAASQLNERTKVIDRARAAIGETKPVVATRLEKLGHFYATVADGIESILGKLNGDES